MIDTCICCQLSCYHPEKVPNMDLMCLSLSENQTKYNHDKKYFSD